MVVEKGDTPPHEGDGRSHHSYTNLVRHASVAAPLMPFDPFLNSAVCEQTVVMVRDIEEETDIDECDGPSLDGEHTGFPNSLFSDCWPGDVRRIKNFAGDIRRYRICDTNNSHVAPIHRRTQVRWTTLQTLLKNFDNQELPRNVRVDYFSRKTKEPFACGEVIEVASDQGRIECFELRVAPVSGKSKLLKEFIEEYKPLDPSDIAESIVSRYGWRARIWLEEIA